MATCFEKMIDVTAMPLGLEGVTKEATALMIGQILTTVAGALASLAALSIVSGHLKHYSQRYLVRLLLLVPLAATTSAVGFRFSKQQTYMAVPLLLIVGMAIADLLRLMMNVVGSEGEEIKEAFRFRKPRRMVFPFRWIRFRPGHDKHLPLVRLAVHQCAILLPLTAIITAFLQEAHIHCPHHLALKLYPQAYIHILLLVSCTLASFAVVNFYYTARSDLQEELDLLRVLVILALLFLPVYQHVLVDILVESGIVPEGHTTSKESLATKLLCLIGNVELLAISLVFYFVLGYRRMQFWELTPTPFVRSLAHALDIREVFIEVFRSLKFIAGREDRTRGQHFTSSKSMLDGAIRNRSDATIPKWAQPYYYSARNNVFQASMLEILPGSRNLRELREQSVAKLENDFSEAINKVNNLKSPALIHYRANDDFRGHEFNPHRLSSPKLAPANNSLEQFSSMSSLDMVSLLRTTSPKNKVHSATPSTLDLTTSPSFPHLILPY